MTANAVVLLTLWALAVPVGAIVGHLKGHAWLGAALGAGLAWVGVLIVAFLPRAYGTQGHPLTRDARGRTVTPGFERAHGLPAPESDPGEDDPR